MKRSFSTDLTRFGAAAKSRCGKAFAEVALGLLYDVQDYDNAWPVDSGWSRASWLLTVGTPGKGVYNYSTGRFTSGSTSAAHGVKPPRGAAIDIPKQASKLPTIKWGDRVYIANNVAYAGRVEARCGVVAAAMARARTNLKKIAERLKK